MLDFNKEDEFLLNKDVELVKSDAKEDFVKSVFVFVNNGLLSNGFVDNKLFLRVFSLVKTFIFFASKCSLVPSLSDFFLAKLEFISRLLSFSPTPRIVDFVDKSDDVFKDLVELSKLDLRLVVLKPDRVKLLCFIRLSDIFSAIKY
jgi:hypothetical protein